VIFGAFAACPSAGGSGNDNIPSGNTTRVSQRMFHLPSGHVSSQGKTNDASGAHANHSLLARPANRKFAKIPGGIPFSVSLIMV
jgi:hypothetical protein